MKGLFLNEFYSAIGNMRLFGLAVIAAAMAFLITGNPTAQELFIYITISALPMNAVSGMRGAVVSKWNRFELTLPVRRRDILRSKYLGYLLWVLLGVLLALAVTFIAALLHGFSDNLTSMFVLGTGIAILAGALFYVLAHLLGADRSETLLFLSVLGAVGLSIFFLNLLHGFGLSSPVSTILFVAACTCCYVFSYVIASAIYRKKEY